MFIYYLLMIGLLLLEIYFLHPIELAYPLVSGKYGIS